MTKRKSGSSAPVRQVAKSAKPTSLSRKKIDFSEIPELSDAQLKSMRRVGRPTLGTNSRHLIAIRIDPDVLKRLQHEAKKLGKGYQSLINDILAEHTKKSA